MNKATIGAIWTGTAALVVIAAALVLMLLVDFDIVALPAATEATGTTSSDPVVQQLDDIHSAISRLSGGTGFGGGSLKGLEDRFECIYDVLRDGRPAIGC